MLSIPIISPMIMGLLRAPDPQTTDSLLVIVCFRVLNAPMPKPQQFWLVKQEPEAYSWSNFVKDGSTVWSGVRNFAARLHLRAMKQGDYVFFYHSVSEKQIVGIARITKEAFPDPTAEEGDWSAVELAPVKSLTAPVTLEVIKNDPLFAQIGLIKQSRLSVMPVTPEQAKQILSISRTKL